MYCNNCGSQVKDGQKFCPNCGSPMGADSTGTVPMPISSPAPTQVPTPTQSFPQASVPTSVPTQTSNPTKASRANTIRNIVILVAGIVSIVVGVFKIYQGFSKPSTPEPVEQTEDLSYVPPESSSGTILSNPAQTPTEPTTTEPTTTEPTTTEPTSDPVPTTSTDSNYYEVTGVIIIMNSDDLAQSGGVDPSVYNSSDRYAIFLIDDPVQMSLQNGDGSGLRDPETVAIICVGSTQMGNLSDWEPYEGQAEHITIRIDPYTTWWPSDVSLPVGQPSTSTATVVS